MCREKKLDLRAIQMINIMGHGNKFDIGMKVREESCLIFSQPDGKLAVIFMEISNSGKEAGIGGNDDEISHVKVKIDALRKSKNNILQTDEHVGLDWKNELQVGNYISLLGLPYQSTTDWVTETVKIYFLPILEARSPRSRC